MFVCILIHGWKVLCTYVRIYVCVHARSPRDHNWIVSDPSDWSLDIVAMSGSYLEISINQIMHVHPPKNGIYRYWFMAIQSTYDIWPTSGRDEAQWWTRWGNSGPTLNGRVSEDVHFLEDHVGVSINGGTPIAGWFMEHPTKVDDDSVFPHLWKPPCMLWVSWMNNHIS